MSESMTLRVVVLRDSDKWIAQCLEHDIAVQADDIDELRHRFSVAFSVDLTESIERQGTPLCGIGAAPQRFWGMWDACSERLESVSPIKGGPVCEMALYEPVKPPL